MTLNLVINWSIPAAALSSWWSGRHPSKINPKMTFSTPLSLFSALWPPLRPDRSKHVVHCRSSNSHLALAVYSVLFMRWALAISPVNYPLFFMHFSNVVAQLSEATRHYRYVIVPCWLPVLLRRVGGRRPVSRHCPSSRPTLLPNSERASSSTIYATRLSIKEPFPRLLCMYRALRVSSILRFPFFHAAKKRARTAMRRERQKFSLYLSIYCLSLTSLKSSPCCSDPCSDPCSELPDEPSLAAAYQPR